MRKSTTLILAVAVLAVLAVLLTYTRSTSNKVQPEEIITETPVPTEEATTDEQTTETQSIAKIKLSGTDFETFEVEISDTQNGIVTDYLLTTDSLNKVSVNTNSFSDLVNHLPTIQAEDILAENVTDLSVYGLDYPRLHLVIDFYNPDQSDAANPTITSTMDFKWGNTLENGNIAVMRTGESTVYAMNGSSLESLQEIATPFYLCSKFIAIPNIKDVASIQVAFPDANYEVLIDDTNGTYTLNNKVMTSDDFKPLYRSIIGIYGEKVLDEASTSPSEISITYTLKDGSTLVADFAPTADSTYYQSTLHGSLIVGCSKAQLDTLRETLAAAAGTVA